MGMPQAGVRMAAMPMGPGIPQRAQAHNPFARVATYDLAKACSELIISCMETPRKSVDTIVNDEAMAVAHLQGALEAQERSSYTSEDRECKCLASMPCPKD